MRHVFTFGSSLYIYIYIYSQTCVIIAKLRIKNRKSCVFLDGFASLHLTYLYN